MKRKTELILLLVSDILTINIAWLIYYYIRVYSELIILANNPSFLAPMIIICVYWLVLFLFLGLYQHWAVRSRFDEVASVFKAVSIGCLLLFFAIFLDDFLKDAKVISRLLILIYWFILIFFIASGRLLIRGLQINLLKKGIGLRNTIVVGSYDKAIELRNTIMEYPEQGYRYIGFVSLNGSEDNVNELGKIENLGEVIESNKVQEVLVGLNTNEKYFLETIINYCSDKNVDIKIMPDMYDTISGLVKSNQIYGIPLISIFPEIMSLPAKIIKRIIDIFSSFVILTLSAPILLIAIIAIKFDSKGPLLYVQDRVGKNGKKFKIYKFRSMYIDAERHGPRWAEKDDPRVTKVGKILRRTRVDEIPQLINVIKGEMSLVGPRPERPFFVDQLKKEIPYYTRRLRVKPGLTGWAQVKHDYDESIDDVRQKLKFDFYYIENMSLTLDLKIILNTIIVVILLKGR